MKTTDLFKTSAKKLNESLAKTFGEKLNLESFDTAKLEDARNKLRTQIHTARTEGGFNENIENETLSKAQFMHDAIVAEIMDRAEHIVSAPVSEGGMDELAAELGEVADSEDFDKLYDLLSDPGPIGQYLQDQISDITGETGLHAKDDFEQIESMLMSKIQQEFGENNNEGVETEGAEFGAYYHEKLAQQVFDENPDLNTSGRAEEVMSAGFKIASAELGKKQAQGMFGYDEDFPSDFVSSYSYLQKQGQDEGVEERVRDPEDWDEGNTEPANNFAISINGKKWKVIKGRGQYADDMAEKNHYRQLQDMTRKKSEETGKRWEVSVTGENPTESISAESAPPTAKGERMVKHIKKGYADDGKLTDKEKSIAYATAWKAHNKNESIEQTGDDMRNLNEGEIQQASAIVTAKTMVDRVGRWIEELSGMENDTLLTLGDSIRDEMGQEMAKQFISACAPAIQAALENLKSTREALSTSVRALTGEEQPAEMLGAEAPEMGADDMGGEAEPDMMNPEMGAEEPAGDDFSAADAAAGGDEEMGRMKRESIDRSSRLLKVLAG